ncbi:hypothetical protein PUNSTDRAFT_126444 [Punctularia strigosozonata HHB-11173 SS5]|uniref:uncharacterized protein n=1 Tax=Punctularia strigosozonata (strain HHB-11173) TaxID=741275 RepID=UPI0004416643|nr:uncharacterized protein PUNSTDRAFT_126444 [Punctularia strigosozonata HHB-11173 SS5]EIN08373.1 hypothetical protein PUNSTDRAFT_126444 [Punctularia strigosozonata HHB-11173 SS5]
MSNNHDPLPRAVMRQRQTEMILGMGVVAGGLYVFWWNLNRRHRNKENDPSPAAIPTWQHRYRKAAFPNERPAGAIATTLRTSKEVLQPDPSDMQRINEKYRSGVTSFTHPSSLGTTARQNFGLAANDADLSGTVSDEEAVGASGTPWHKLTHEEKMARAGSEADGYIPQKSKQRVQKYPGKEGLAYTKSPDYVDSYGKTAHLKEKQVADQKTMGA